ncbi:hypothetical protein AX16_005628 [Volvariella volvacea WC 439]|nr:hypothetical protein AX16_005628 [Volvariella volvacea WC 439]
MAPLIPNSSAPHSPPESGFVPRKEFIRDPVTRHTFALLAIAGSNLVKLFSFPDSVSHALRMMLANQEYFKYYREDREQHMCEFTIHGKPWTSSKAFATEKLLMDIITLICRCGFSYLSTIDYGREQDDRLTIAFARPIHATFPSPSGTPQLGTPLVDGVTTHADRSRPLHLPFGLSFVSATVLRVISPPLHSTPAILQAVRGSWPRGVVSEKKVGSNSYEFKLRGYSFFQQDTFATDSLTYILSLLSTLDQHSFSLVTSLSLSSRSRVKDLWVFTCHSHVTADDSVPPSILNNSHPDIRRRRTSNDPATGIPSNHHYRVDPHSSHQRAHSEQNHARKGGPRTHPQQAFQHEADSYARVKLPSTVSSSVENMTGVGAGSQQSSPPQNLGDIPDSASDITADANGQPTPRPSLAVSPSDSITDKESRPNPPVRSQTWSSEGGLEGNTVPALLGPGAFRDSAISTGTDDNQSNTSQNYGDRSSRRSDRLTTSQALPGGWQPSPIEESTEEETQPPEQRAPPANTDQGHDEPLLHQVESRHTSPLLNAAIDLRKSEAAVIVDPSTIPAPVPLPMPHLPSPQGSPPRPVRQGSPPHRPGRGRPREPRGSGGSHGGWVLVNVEGRASPGTDSTEHRGRYVQNTSPRLGRAPESQPGSPSHSNSSSPKRTFSLTRKNVSKFNEQTRSQSVTPQNNREPAPEKTRQGFFDRLQHIGTPQASRNERKRQSLD